MSETLALTGGGGADSGANGTNGGRVSFSGGNELQVDSYDQDPPFIRVGMTLTEQGGGGGGIGFDHLSNGPGGRRVEMVLIHGEQAEQGRGQPGNLLSAVKIQLNHGGEGDSDMRDALVLTARSGPSARPGGGFEEAFRLGEEQWESLVRQLWSRISGPAPAPPSASADGGSYDGAQMQGLEGKFLYARQADGHDVLYAKDGAAIWTSDGGPHGTWLG